MNKFTLLFAFAVLCSCSAFRADPAPDSGFLSHPEQLEERRERFPFNAVWFSDEYLKERFRYDKLVIKDIDFDHLLSTTNWHHLKTVSDDEVRAELIKLGKYFDEAFEREFLSDVNKRVAIVQTPGANTLQLEVAFVELVPTDVLRNALGDVLGFFVPGGGLASAGSGGSLAIEGRLRDTETGEVVGKFKDREQAKLRPIDLEGLTAYGFAYDIIDEWAEQSVELFNSPSDHKVVDSDLVSLRPW